MEPNFKKLRGEIEWTTGLGENILIKRMETSHIQNTIILLTGKQENCDKLQLGDMVIKNRKANDWIELFRTELQYRADPKSILPKPEESKPVEKEQRVML